MKLTAWDEFHNPITSYARTHKLALRRRRKRRPTARRPNTPPTTEPTFTGGEATLTGFRFYKAARTTLKVKEEMTGHEGQATFTVKAGPAATFKLSAPDPAEPEAGQAFNVTITALDAGGNVATGYGGAGGENKTIAYSGAEVLAVGQGARIPRLGHDRQLPRRRRHAERHQALPLRREHAHREGRHDRRVGGLHGEGGQRRLPSSSPRPAPAEPEVGQASSVTSTALDVYGNLAPSYGGAGGENKTIAYSGPTRLALGQGARIPRPRPRP